MRKLIIIFVVFLASRTLVAAQEPTPTETPIPVATESPPDLSLPIPSASNKLII